MVAPVTAWLRPTPVSPGRCGGSTIRPPSFTIKGRPSGDPAPLATPLRAGPTYSSLVNDEDDEIVDHFSAPCLCDVPALDGDDDVDASPRSPWDVRECHVRAVPAFYPLERSSVVVRQAAASVVAARIAAVLQDRAIAASYDARNAKADGVSGAGVEFRIRLYRGGEGGRAEGIVVEVQRRWGFAPCYMHDVYAILDAAEGKDVEEAHPTWG